MPAMLDLPNVQAFTEDLAEQVRRCDNGEGMICSNLEDRINALLDKETAFLTNP